eukprot:g54327.t1
MHFRSTWTAACWGCGLLFAGCPEGWLLADGSPQSSSDYPKLAQALAGSFGSSSSTFTLPDLRGEFLRGLDYGRNVDPSRAHGTSQQQDFKSFTIRSSLSGGVYSHGVRFSIPWVTSTLPFLLWSLVVFLRLRRPLSFTNWIPQGHVLPVHSHLLDIV